MDKELTPLEALEIIKHCTNLNIPNEMNGYQNELYLIETALKALEIIKEEKVNVGWLLEVGNAETYNFAFPKTDRHLTQEEYDLLKEVLSDGK